MSRQPSLPNAPTPLSPTKPWTPGGAEPFQDDWQPAPTKPQDQQLYSTDDGTDYVLTDDDGSTAIIVGTQDSEAA